MTRLAAEQLAAYASGHYTDDRRDMAAEILELREQEVPLCESVRDLTQQRLDLEERLLKANRQIEEFDVSGKRQDETITRLMTDRGRLEDELASYKDALQISQKDRDDWKAVAESMAESVNDRAATIVQLTRERDAAREFNRRFRACVDIHEDLDGIRSLDGKGLRKVCRDCDATQTPQPQLTEWVPWTSETRPSGPVVIRENVRIGYEFPVDWTPYGVEIGRHGTHNWKELFRDWQWSRDGKEWNRCGTEVAN